MALTDYVIMPGEDWQAICDAIRSKTGDTALLKSGDVAVAPDQLVEVGKKEAHDLFWDVYQENGTRAQYYYAFSYFGWTDDTFKPKYDMTPTNASAMFKQSKITKDLTKESMGVSIDFSKATTTQETFNNARFPLVDVVDLSSVSGNGAAGMFGYNNYLHTIKKLILHENMSFTNFFAWSDKLVNITVEGTIANSISIHASRSLSKASIQSFFAAFSGSVSGMTFTVSKTAVNKAFETASGANDGSSSQEWLSLVATKPNWTVEFAT